METLNVLVEQSLAFILFELEIKIVWIVCKLGIGWKFDLYL